MAIILSFTILASQMKTLDFWKYWKELLNFIPNHISIHYFLNIVSNFKAALIFGHKMVFATPGYIPNHIQSSEEEESLFSLESQAKFTLHFINWLLQACH